VRYLNRLSSLLFMLARAEDLHDTGHLELAKQPRSESESRNG
jgi:cob(I)alamin adenosyltransferase